MATLAEATLTDAERRALERLVPLLEEEFGPALHAVWLYGSRARGEPPHEESDVDLLIVSDDASPQDTRRVSRRLEAAAAAEGTSPWVFSPRVYSPERIAERREIRSFFIQEVDRDKVVLYGEP
ncbi:MAG: nucleotidyltransferase domain-containing protein [Gaiellaceae bacterium]